MRDFPLVAQRMSIALTKHLDCIVVDRTTSRHSAGRVALGRTRTGISRLVMAMLYPVKLRALLFVHAGMAG